MINNFIIKRKKLINYNISVAQVSLSLLHLQIAWSVPQNCVFLLEVGEVIVISLFLFRSVKPVSGQSILEVYDIV